MTWAYVSCTTRTVCLHLANSSVFEALQDPDLEWLIVDSTVIRAHPAAAGAGKKGTAAAVSGSRPSVAVGAGSAPRCLSR